MKLLLWLLLLSNVVLLAYFQLGSQQPAGPLAGHQAIDPGKIRILTPEELARLPKRGESLLPSSPSPAAASMAVAACYEWGSFAVPDAARAKAALDRIGLESTAKPQTPQEAVRYWVYIPPRESLEKAQAKVDEIKALGIEESFIIQEPKWRFAVSLGVFKADALATKFLEELHSRGIKSAVKGRRNQEGWQTGYTIKNVLPAQVEEIGKLKPDFPGSELKQVNCQ
jgi:hypothetical protein